MRCGIVRRGSAMIDHERNSKIINLRHRAPNLSTREIADKLGLERNVVCGVIRRAQKRNELPPAIATPRRRDGPFRRDATPWRLTQVQGAEPKQPQHIEPSIPLTGPGVTLEAVRNGQCRYPYGEPTKADFVLCGHRTRPGSVYCPDHHAACTILIRLVKPAPQYAEAAE